MTKDEQDAWDRFAAAALSGMVVQKPEATDSAATRAARAADKLLELRRERRAKGPNPDK